MISLRDRRRSRECVKLIKMNNVYIYLSEVNILPNHA